MGLPKRNTWRSVPGVDIWAAIADERESLMATLAELSPQQWASQSLCGDWTVHEVLGHLVVAAKPPRRRIVLETLKARGNFDKANCHLAQEQAERPPAELLTTYRELVGHRFKPPGFGPESTLADILMHSLDIRIPLGLPTERPVERYASAIEVYFNRLVRLTVGPRGRPALHWMATDVAWQHGSGSEVRGTIADLMLTASGRGARIDALTGSGQPVLADWVGRH
jgi:uncharacterized protein (TIGR03083 family)